MAATGNVTVSGNVSNLSAGSSSNFGPSTSNASAAVEYNTTVTLTTGANTITLPTGLTSLIIVGPNGTNPTPNPSSGSVLTLKGVAGDTGVPMSNAYPTVLQWDTGQSPASIVINASAGCTIQLWTQ